jgi:hypothetical protein
MPEVRLGLRVTVVVTLIAGATLVGCGTSKSAAAPASGGRAPGLANQSGGSAPPTRPASPSTSASAPATPRATTTPPRPPAPAGSCQFLPSNSVWHADISHAPVNSRSTQYVRSIGPGANVHADFGSGTWDGGPIGIPITTVSGSQAKVPVTFQYKGDSDKGPYPVPASPKIEGGSGSRGDRHVLLLDTTHCIDYELFAAYPSGSSWRAGSGAIFDLSSNKLRPAGWTSADAAGLPILPGLVTYAEVKSGQIHHAIRVTVPDTQAAYIWPARHQASDSHNPALPPMGLRLRLKATVDVSKLPYQARIVAVAMQKYGVIVADNGSAWYISGEPNSHWNNDQLHGLDVLTGKDFEAIDESSLEVTSSSGEAR